MKRRKLNPLRQRPLTAVAPQLRRQVVIPKRGGGEPPAELRNYAFFPLNQTFWFDNEQTAAVNRLLRANARTEEYYFQINNTPVARTGSTEIAGNTQHEMNPRPQPTPTGNLNIRSFGTNSGSSSTTNVMQYQVPFRVRRYWPADAASGRYVSVLNLSTMQETFWLNYNRGSDANDRTYFLGNETFESATRGFQGFIWDVRWWDGDPDQGGTVLKYFPINEGSGNTLVDELGGDPLIGRGASLRWVNDVALPPLEDPIAA